MKKTPDLFDTWNDQKKHIEFISSDQKNFRIGEIWWYWEGINIGDEISKDGKFLRPCIILDSHAGKNISLVLPLTTKYHTRNSHALLYIKTPHIQKKSWGMLNAIKNISHKRLAYRMKKIYLKKYVINRLIGTYVLFIQKKLPREEEAAEHEKSVSL